MKSLFLVRGVDNIQNGREVGEFIFSSVYILSNVSVYFGIPGAYNQ